MGIVCSDHVGGLLAEGWSLTPGDRGVTDVACAHYHLANWEGGHDGCCEMR